MITHKSAPFLVAAVAVAAAEIFAAAVRLPDLFAYSGPLQLALIALLLSGAGMLLLPDRLLHPPARLLRHAFQERHGVSAGRAESALQAVTALQAHVARLRRAEGLLSPELGEKIRPICHILEDAARAIFYEPDILPAFRSIVVRSESVIDAVEAQVKLRHSRADKQIVSSARERVLGAVQSLNEALDASLDREVHSLLDKIEVASSTAEALLKPRKPATKGTRQ